VAKIEWSRLGPDQCEGVLGVLLLRRHQRARRVRPSQGDGGVDVYVPGINGWTIYQVKSFTGPLTRNHKTQITNSWKAFLQLVEERQIVVNRWVIIRPENPTWQDQKFLDDVTSDAAWPCEWHGLDHCDELAASYPDVLDYYLRDGKERLDGALRQHLTAAGFGRRNGGDPVAPVASVETLQAIHDAVNAIDPHYRYDFAVAHRPIGVPVEDRSSWPEMPAATTEGLVASAIRYEDDRAVVFHVYARFEQATDERPVPLQFRVMAEEGTAEHDAWRDFLDYGVATQEPLPVSGLTVDMPGEFGPEEAEGLIRVGPPAGSQPTMWTLTILDHTGREVLAAVDLEGGPPSYGMTRRGWSLELRDPHGAIDLLLRVDTESSRTTYRLRHLPLFGKAPRDLLPGMRLAAAFHAPNTVQVAVAGGPPLADPMDLTGTLNPAFAQMIGILENLATIQQHTFARVVVPELRYVVREAYAWEVAARLLRGERLEASWTHLSVDTNGKRPIAVGDLFAVMTTDQLEVEVGGVRIELGSVIRHCPAVRADSIELKKDGSRVARLAPHQETPFTVYQPRSGSQPAMSPGSQ
jgi:hypothetical protein